ncbi:hypothetical protein HJ096_10750 [Vibrio parahaemolyticus]|nr:hypothetical protein [Vibrio parahaemolyticus]
MKRLKIERSQATYTVDGINWVSIEKIGKEDLLFLVDTVFEEDFDMDNPDESRIGNEAHKIIYENIYKKFKKLIEEKRTFKMKVKLNTKMR